MKTFGYISATVFALTLSGVAATAQQAGVPAEFPPASFTGNQFVDSRGCAFVRAGIGGNVNWVPRVSRSRDQLCNFQPTFEGGAGRTAVAAPSQSAPNPLAGLPDAAEVAAAEGRAVTATPAPAPQAAPAPVVATAPVPTTANRIGRSNPKYPDSV